MKRWLVLVIVPWAVVSCGPAVPARTPPQRAEASAPAVAALAASKFEDAARQAGDVLASDPGNARAAAVRAIGPLVGEHELAGRALERDHRARPLGVAGIEPERRAPAWIALGELAALAVELELEQLAIGLVDPAVAVPVALPAREAQLERELAIAGDHGEVAIDRLEPGEEALPGRAPAGVVEELEPVGLVDDAAQLLEEAVAGGHVGRDHRDRPVRECARHLAPQRAPPDRDHGLAPEAAAPEELRRSSNGRAPPACWVSGKVSSCATVGPEGPSSCWPICLAKVVEAVLHELPGECHERAEP